MTSLLIGVSGRAVQPVPLASLKLSMAVYGQKAIMHRSKLKNKFNRNRTDDNWNKYKQQRINVLQC